MINNYEDIDEYNVPDWWDWSLMEDSISEDITKSQESDILKAWQGAQIGEKRTHKDGKTYKKVGNSGVKNKDWKLVTDTKNNKAEPDSVPKKGSNSGNKEGSSSDKGGLATHAKEASETNLNAAIKESDDANIRQAAHEEIDRRGKEESIQEEKEESPGKEESKIKSSKEKVEEETVESLVKELRALRDEDLDYSDLSALDENDKKQREVRGKIEKIKEDESNLRKVGFEEYRKGFKSFDNSDLKGVKKYYGEVGEKIRQYLDKNKEQSIAINTYENSGFVAIRSYLTNPKEYNKEIVNSSMDSDIVKEVSEDLSKFINNNKITENLSLNRRVKGDGSNFFKSLNKGDVYEDKSFSSTSLKELDHFGDFNIEILAKKNSNISNIDGSSEYEYLIDKGSKFRVLGKSDTGIIVELL